MHKAVESVNGEIFDAIGGFEAEEQVKIDEAMIALDGTPNKARLGANAILGVSLAVAKAAARGLQPAALPLCRRDDGARAAGADDEHRQRRRARRQPDRLPGIHDHAARRAELRARRCAGASEVFHTLKGLLKKAGHNTNVGDEGGFAPNLPSAEAALDFCVKAIEAAGYKPGEDIALGARPGGDASSSRTAPTSMRARARRARSSEQVDYLAKLVDAYPIVSIEDGMAEDDWSGWKLLTEKLGEQHASSSATTCSSPTSSASAAASRRASPIRS